MKKMILSTVMVLAATAAYAADETGKAAIPGLTGLEKIEPIKANTSMFSSNKPVTLPKGWRFIGVSNGEKINSNNLWFQDADGNIFLISGYNDGSKFYLSGNIQTLEAK